MYQRATSYLITNYIILYNYTLVRLKSGLLKIDDQTCMSRIFRKNHHFLSKKLSTLLKIGNLRISKNIDSPKNREFTDFQKHRFS